MGTAGVSDPAATDLLGQPVKQGSRGEIPRWAERYGYSVRQIKNWRADGLAKELPAPLNHPERMAEWFAAVYSKKAPAKLLEAIERMTGQATPAAAVAETEAVRPVEEPFVVPDISSEEMGIEADLKRFRQVAVMAHRLHGEALGKGEFAKARGYMDQAREISGEIRQLEKLLPAVMEAKGEWMRTAEVKRATMEFLGVLFRALDVRGTRAADRLRNLEGDAEITRAWREEVRTVFEECCEGNFQETWQLEA